MEYTNRVIQQQLPERQSFVSKVCGRVVVQKRGLGGCACGRAVEHDMLCNRVLFFLLDFPFVPFFI